MSVLIDARPYAVAVKTALDATLGPDPATGESRAYDYDDLPGSLGNEGTPPGIFVAISLERRGSLSLRMSARAGTSSWRLAVRSVGMTVDECRWAQHKTAVALNEARLLVGDRRTTPIQYESGDAPAYDDGRYSATDLYVYDH